MAGVTRRQFLAAVAGAALSGPAAGAPWIARGVGGRVVVVGGGAGGATAAKYIRLCDPSIDVTLVEPHPEYYTGFMSNEVLGGERSLASIRFNYDGLRKRGVRVVFDVVTRIDPAAKVMTTAAGVLLPYDRAIVSPGVDFRYEDIEGYGREATGTMPHAWKAGLQTALLRKQLETMKDGGLFVIAPPATPYRCPSGPYERASQAAHYLQRYKPRAKIIILDANDSFAGQALFEKGWSRLYGYGTAGSLIEWVPRSRGGAVGRVDVTTLTVYAGDAGGQFKADVANIIPPQHAGKIAFDTGLVDRAGWCPVDVLTFESTMYHGIHVTGDAAVAAEMPKSAYAANIQAKVAAQAIVDLLNGRTPRTPTYLNTAYSLLAPEYGISVATVYRPDVAEDRITVLPDAGGATPIGASDNRLRREVADARSWYADITDDMFG